jgi:CheY-like chemotaxis protein
VKALIVEDNALTGEALGTYLEAAGIRVDHAGNGLGALTRMALRPYPDVVITDQLMPAMSGVELVAEMRRRPELAAVPAVVITAMADGPELEEKRRRLDGLGPARLLRKPFEMADLLKAVREAAPGA